MIYFVYLYIIPALICILGTELFLRDNKLTRRLVKPERMQKLTKASAKERLAATFTPVANIVIAALFIFVMIITPIRLLLED